MDLRFKTTCKSEIISKSFSSPQNFHQLPYRYFRLVAIVVLCVSDALDIGRMANTSLHRQTGDSTAYGRAVTISIWAHIGGAIAGILAGALLYASSATGSVATITVAVVRMLAFLAAVLAVLVL